MTSSVIVGSPNFVSGCARWLSLGAGSGVLYSQDARCYVADGDASHQGTRTIA